MLLGKNTTSNANVIPLTQQLAWSKYSKSLLRVRVYDPQRILAETEVAGLIKLAKCGLFSHIYSVTGSD